MPILLILSQLRARHINPAGELAAHSEAVSTFIAHGIRHIFGTITSASRKEIILDLEQHNLPLWCGCPYEGFESCGAGRRISGRLSEPDSAATPCGWRWICFGNRPWLIGSNYVCGLGKQS